MVLHNSKWDKKATRNYNRKHGITKPPSAVAGPQAKYTRHKDAPTHHADSDDSSEDGGTGSSSDESEENDPDNLSALIPEGAEGPPQPSSRRSRRNIKNLPSNTWRYKVVSDDDEALIHALTEHPNKNELDEEEQMILAEQVRDRRTRQQIEEEELQMARSVKRDPKQIDLGAVAAADLQKQKTRKHRKNARGEDDDEDESYEMGSDEDDDLEFLLAADSANSSSKHNKDKDNNGGGGQTKPQKGQVKPFEDKKSQFYELQQEIEKAKAAKEIKRRFAPKSTAATAGVSAEKMARAKQRSRVDPEEDIDDFLASIDGLSVGSVGIEEGDDAKMKGPSLFSGSTSKPRQHDQMLNSEAWLDNLLN